MIAMHRAVVTMLLAVVALSSTAHAGDQTAMTFKKRLSEQVELDYLLHLPQGYMENKDQRWPLILFLHGAGERGDDLSIVAKHGQPAIGAHAIQLEIDRATYLEPCGRNASRGFDRVARFIESLAQLLGQALKARQVPAAAE